MTELLKDLIDFLKEASPFVWQTLLKQAYIEAWSKIAWGVIVLAIAIALFYLGRYGKKVYEDDCYSGWEIGHVICFIFSGGAFLISPALLIGGIKWLINPEFYAIRYILQQLQ